MIFQALVSTQQSDYGLAAGILLVILIVLFSGLFIWAWSDRRKATFQRAGHLPLEDDDTPVNSNLDEDNQTNKAQVQKNIEREKEKAT